MIRQSLFKIAVPTARRLISNSSRASNISAVSQVGREVFPSAESSASSGRVFKAIAYTTLGSVVVAAGFSQIFKDEVVYWTPNTRK